MPINWTDNKVLNSNTQQRTTYNSKPPMTAVPQMDNMQMNMPKSNTMGDNMMSPDMMSNNDMMNPRVMNDRMMNDQGMMNEGMRMNDMTQNQMTQNQMFQQGPPPVMDKNYLAGYLTTQIGKRVRAEFPLPGGFFIDKAGVLKEVGVNFFILEDFVSRANIICDLYSVKFVYIL